MCTVLDHGTAHRIVDSEIQLLRLAVADIRRGRLSRPTFFPLVSPVCFNRPFALTLRLFLVFAATLLSLKSYFLLLTH